MYLPGRFIVIDGGEGAGKGTVIERLKQDLPSDVSTVFTREPGGSKFAEMIRELILSEEGKKAGPKTLFGLFWSARADHFELLVEPALREGQLVICDRFEISTFAHQICGHEYRGLQELFWQTRKVFCGVTPDHYIYLDVDPTEGERRTKSRSTGNHIDEKGLPYHMRVREGYLEFLTEMPHGATYRIIDANRELEAVYKEVLEEVMAFV